MISHWGEVARPVILAAWEVKIRRILAEDSPGKKFM
jgi:hypothetical protein